MRPLKSQRGVFFLTPEKRFLGIINSPPRKVPLKRSATKKVKAIKKVRQDPIESRKRKETKVEDEQGRNKVVEITRGEIRGGALKSRGVENNG